MENIKKKKYWKNKVLSSMNYYSYKRKNYKFIQTKDKKTYILAYNYKENEDFLFNLDKVKDYSVIIYEKLLKKELSEKEYQKEKDLLKEKIKHITKNFRNIKNDTIYKGWSILDNLISLRQNLSYSYNINEEFINEKEIIELENSLSKKDKRIILNWCNEYGLPFLGDKVIINNIISIDYLPFKYGFKNDINTCFIENMCVCRLGSFLIALNILLKTLIYFLNYIYTIPDIIEYISFDFNYDENDIISYLNKALNSISIISNINFKEIINEKKSPDFNQCAETIISLAMYQLALMMSSKKIYLTKKCSYCENLFISTRATRVYCMNCSRQKKYKNSKK